MTGWETTERVLESGGFESRQRVLVPEPVVEASEAGARTLGVTYWQAVDRFTRGGVRASWSGGGGKLKLLGGATLLTFGPPELSFDGGLVSCRHAIRGGLLALRAGGSVTLAQRAEGEQQELSVTVEEYLPRLAARAGAPRWTGMLYAKGAEPLPCRCQPPLLRAPAAGAAAREGDRLRRDRRRRPSAAAPAGRARGDGGLADAARRRRRAVGRRGRGHR